MGSGNMRELKGKAGRLQHRLAEIERRFGPACYSALSAAGCYFSKSTGLDLTVVGGISSLSGSCCLASS